MEESVLVEIPLVEEMVLRTGVRSLKSDSDGCTRCCFGLALGVLVPLILALLVVLRSADVSGRADPLAGQLISGINQTRASPALLNLRANVSRKTIQPSNRDSRKVREHQISTTQMSATMFLDMPGRGDADSDFLDIKQSDAVLDSVASPNSGVSADSHPNSQGTPAFRGAASSITHRSLPWYSYLAYASSVATGIAWVALAAKQCQVRAE